MMDTVMPTRSEKVSELLRREISRCIIKEAATKNALITLTRVEVSEDIRHADVYFATIPDSASFECLGALKESTLNIQKFLYGRLRIRPIPKIQFHIDKAEQEAAKIDEIIDDL